MAPVERTTRWYKSWTQDELAIVSAHLDEMPGDIQEKYLPGRPASAIRNKWYELKRAEVRPAVKAPGDYLEVLAAFFTDEFDCMEIWLRWNGYASCRVLSTDALGWSTLLCTAKGET